MRDPFDPSALRAAAFAGALIGALAATDATRAAEAPPCPTTYMVVELTLNADGTVAEAVVVQATAPKEFVDRMLAWVRKEWRWSKETAAQHRGRKLRQRIDYTPTEPGAC